jgi:hypothetical protein
MNSNQRRDQQAAINDDLFSQLYLNMFRAFLRPSSGDLTAHEYVTVCVISGFRRYINYMGFYED